MRQVKVQHEGKEDIQPKYGAVDGEEKEGILAKTMHGLGNIQAPAVLLGDANSNERALMTNPSVREKELARIEKLLDGAVSGAPPALVPLLKKIEPCLAGCTVW